MIIQKKEMQAVNDNNIIDNLHESSSYFYGPRMTHICVRPGCVPCVYYAHAWNVSVCCVRVCVCVCLSVCLCATYSFFHALQTIEKRCTCAHLCAWDMHNAQHTNTNIEDISTYTHTHTYIQHARLYKSFANLNLAQSHSLIAIWTPH